MQQNVDSFKLMNCLKSFFCKAKLLDVKFLCSMCHYFGRVKEHHQVPSITVGYTHLKCYSSLSLHFLLIMLISLVPPFSLFVVPVTVIPWSRTQVHHIYPCTHTHRMHLGLWLVLNKHLLQSWSDKISIRIKGTVPCIQVKVSIYSGVHP